MKSRVENKDMDEVYKSGRMAAFMRAIGRMTKPMDAAVLSTQMETFTTVIGQMTKPAVMVFIPILMELNTRVIGKMISSMVKVRKYGPTVRNTKATISLDKKMVLVNSFGLTNRLSMATFLRTIFMVTELIVGQMVENIAVNGFATKCMERVFFFGVIRDATKAAISMTKNTDMVFSCGQMEGSMTASG